MYVMWFRKAFFSNGQRCKNGNFDILPLNLIITDNSLELSMISRDVSNDFKSVVCLSRRSPRSSINLQNCRVCFAGQYGLSVFAGRLGMGFVDIFAVSFSDSGLQCCLSVLHRNTH